MVNNFEAQLDYTFAALSDPTRRAILARLALGEATVGELAAPFEVSLPAVSKHLRVLESAGLLERQVDGRIHRCRLAPAPMKDAAAWIEHYRIFWEAQLESLALYLETQTEKDKWPERKQSSKKRKRSHPEKNGPQ